MWGWTLVEDVARDLRHSVRLLVRSPLFTAVAVLSLALGIGANTAIFSLADAVIFRDLPVREPQRLFQVRGSHQRGINTIYSYPLYQQIRDHNRVFSSTVCAGSWAILEPIALVLPDESRREIQAPLTAVSGNYFDTLGVEPVIGRTFTPDEDRAPGAQPVAVVSYRFWKHELSSDPRIVNARLLHNGVTYEILGVAPRSFTGISSNDDPDVWVPIMMVDALLSSETIKNPDTSSLYVFGRLKPAVSDADASGDISAIYEEIQRRALGASSRAVQWMILRDVLVLVITGAAFGIPAALAAAGIIRGLLFGLTPADPVTIAGATGALILIALVAAYLPALRACRIDPIQALRSE